MTWHKLRHTFATKMMRDISLPHLQKLLGHRWIVSTERYLHVDPEGLQQVYDAAKAKLKLDLTYQVGR